MSTPTAINYKPHQPPQLTLLKSLVLVVRAVVRMVKCDYCSRSAIVKCMLCHGGSGIDWAVVIVVIVMVVMAVLRMSVMIRELKVEITNW